MAAIETQNHGVPDLIFSSSESLASSVGNAINAYYLEDEAECVARLIEIAKISESGRKSIQINAQQLVEAVRRNRKSKGGLDSFLKKYDLSSQEGVVLMCLAEALLRIPDADTADKLIADKLSEAKWEEHVGTSDSWFVNASTWGLMLTGKLMQPEDEVLQNPAGFLGRMASRMGEPVVRTAMRQAMRIMGHQFVMGRTIEDALKRATTGDNKAYRHSFDMLGEAALTADDADRYFDAYSDAIKAIGNSIDRDSAFASRASISVKLSALFPRYEFAQRMRVLDELTPKVLALAELAKDNAIPLTVDAEEADRLELSMEVFEKVYRSDTLNGWNGLGLALQVYQRRALFLVRWLKDLANDVKRQIPIRLVKGAYWDTEIKRAQEDGHASYPVFTRKPSTDVSYLACARELLDNERLIYPQFATHNAHTVASILHFAKDGQEFEFQRLHGMGEELYEEVVGKNKMNIPCRVYAPVGIHEDLLPYLVRRLLENGANTSFVNRIVDEKAPIEDIVADPIAIVKDFDQIPHARIPAPEDLFGKRRKNSHGVNFSDRDALNELSGDMQRALTGNWIAAPIVGGEIAKGAEIASLNPYDRSHVVGRITQSDTNTIKRAVDVAVKAQPGWDSTAASERAAILNKAADLFEQHAAQLLVLCNKEAGKTLPDAVAELREAVDFLRYYAAGARDEFSEPQVMPGPTGESNELWLRGRGVFVCISPWNFPLAIFTGQVAAALAAGNAVLAKPAEQTSIIAYRAVELMHEAGVPKDVLNFIPGPGSVVGATAIADPRIAGVAFTGSTATAHRINRTLADRDGVIAALIAETGGQNAMIVDSSALPEQVVLDVVQSSFNSAGQRCSALRVLCVQDDIADRVIELLTGYMKELVIGDPAMLTTDVGPVIDESARDGLLEHVDTMKRDAKIIYQCHLPESLSNGTFVPPTAIEIDNIGQLEREQFGPVLHIVRFDGDKLDQLIDDINATGYGLTLGIHSRVDSNARKISQRANVGNIYINRNMVGAVVGVQPFGGCNLSGTGPKAGGPHYLHRFATERTVTVNTSAVGGNASLLSLESD